MPVHNQHHPGLTLPGGVRATRTLERMEPITLHGVQHRARIRVRTCDINSMRLRYVAQTETPTKTMIRWRHRTLDRVRVGRCRQTRLRPGFSCAGEKVRGGRSVEPDGDSARVTTGQFIAVSRATFNPANIWQNQIREWAR